MVEEPKMLHDVVNSSVSSVFMDCSNDGSESCCDHFRRHVGCATSRDDDLVNSSVVSSASQYIVGDDVVPQLRPLRWG